jgi:hypothetical protein
MIMVSQPRGHQVLPNQDLGNTFLPPNRREPLGGWPTSATGYRHPGATRPTATDREIRRPAGLGRSPGPVRPAPLRSCQGPTPDHHHPAHRTGPHLRATLATDRVPAGHRATPGRTPLRVRCRAGDLPHRPASPLRPRQRSGCRQVADRLPDRRVRTAATPSPLPGHGLAR